MDRVEATVLREADKAHAADRLAKDAAKDPDPALTVKDGVEVAKYHDDAPTQARRQHDPITRQRQLVGKEYRMVSRSIDLMGQMQRSGMINPQQALSGRRFHALFNVAGFQALRAQDLGAVGGGGAYRDTISHRASDAAKAIGDIIEHLGGHGTPVAKAAWDVVGWGKSIKEWTDGERLPGRKLNEQVGRGLVIGAVVALDVYFYMTGPGRQP